MEEEKKGIVTREIDKFRETMKIREAEKEEQDKKRKGSKSPSRRKSKSRERDSESRSRWQINHIQSKIANYMLSSTVIGVELHRLGLKFNLTKIELEWSCTR